MLKRLIPSSLAAWKILPSTSMLTALVHSSSKANWGLKNSHKAFVRDLSAMKCTIECCNWKVIFYELLSQLHCVSLIINFPQCNEPIQSYRSTSRLLYYLPLHCAEETQPVENSCPQLQILGFQFGLYRVVVLLLAFYIVSLASLYIQMNSAWYAPHPSHCLC